MKDNKDNFDYKRIFSENVSAAHKNSKDENKDTEIIKLDETEKKIKAKMNSAKEKKYISTFLMQSVICLLIITSIVVAKYTTPKTFVSVSSVLNGLYENNITLSDLNKFIDEKVLGSEALAAFFNMTANGE